MTNETATLSRETLPEARSVLVVCAHPDDESFGLGAAISTFGESGASTTVLCFTHGEASTLGADVGDLGQVRSEELATAAVELGVRDVELLHYGDGRLSEESLGELSDHVDQMIDRSTADLLLVFDEGGITGHADHCRATEAALAAARERGLAVLAWAMDDEVATALNQEFGAGFIGREANEIDLSTHVDRSRQRRAIACHVSQASDNPVLRRRLVLQGDREVFRWLVPPR
ncbi:MAG: PIG-L family deacetylase [Acidobacteria bacterium]|nr:PIG-L family deacetylase [Acidobacteriota bacterium]